jgi:peroxiredoxin
MKTLIILSAVFMLMSSDPGEGYNIGDKASDFALKNIDGKMISLSDYKSAKGFVVIFTCNHCPFAKAYEDRIIHMDKIYKDKGYPVIAINPNDESIVPEDSFEKMIDRAKEKSFTFPYLRDEKQKVANKYGATRTPHVYLLNKEKDDLIVRYIGTIDNNYQDENSVTETYLTDAIDALINKKLPDPDFTKAVGCTIKRPK